MPTEDSESKPLDTCPELESESLTKEDSFSDSLFNSF
jgi:hypothetical protein